jgi:hypothetical protein
MYSGRVFAAARADTSWRVGKRVLVEVRAIDSQGVDVPNAPVRAFVLRHRPMLVNWQTGLPERDIVDTVRRTELRPKTAASRALSFTPDSAGEYARGSRRDGLARRSDANRLDAVCCSNR